MIGSLSSFFMGYFSDKYGRKTICLIMSILMSLSIILSELFQLEIFGLSINSKYIIYFISQFFIGFTSYVLYVTSYVLLLEITTTKNSTIVSNVNLYLFVVGELLTLIIGYVLRNWHSINYFLIFYSILIVLMVALVLPESPRYLVTLKKYRKAYKILKRIAKVNGTSQKLLNENEMIRLFKSSVSNKNKEQEENNPLNEQFNNKYIEKEKDTTLIDYLTNPLFNLIKEHFMDLRSGVQLTAEEVILQVNDISTKLIEKIDEYEKDTIQFNNNNSKSLDAFNAIVKELESFHAINTEYLKKYEVDDTVLVKLNEDATNLINKVELEIESLKELIFNEKKPKFNKNSEIFNEAI